MQIPGSTCAICGEMVTIAPDGTWCDTCKSVFHTSCLVAAGSECPTCQAPCTSPDETELLDAQGSLHHSQSIRRSVGIGPMVEIIIGAILVISPIAILVIAFGVRFGGSTGGLVVALLFSLIFIVMGVTLVVDGEKNMRGRR